MSHNGVTGSRATPRLETARLILQPLALEDAVQVQPLFSQWNNVRLLATRVPWPYPADGTYTFYRDVTLPAVARGEQWVWTLRLKTAPEQIIGSLAYVLGEENRGFWLAAPYRRLGLMTEAVEAGNAFWFGVLGMPLLRVNKASENVASRRISEKTGGHVVSTGEKDFVAGRLPAEVWELTAAAWRWRQGGSGDGAELSLAGQAELVIRVAVDGDLEQVMALERGAATAPHWAEGEYRAMVQEQAPGGVRRCLFVAAGQPVAGFAVGKVVAGEAELESVVVLGVARRRGVGRALCHAVMEWAAGEGAGVIGLEVRAGSLGAIGLYAGLGFVEVGRRPGYYERPAEEAVVMRCGLGRG